MPHQREEGDRGPGVILPPNWRAAVLAERDRRARAAVPRRRALEREFAKRVRSATVSP
jgi:hypothetical protein